MSTFTCACGHVTHADDEAPGTTSVAYTLAELQAIEHRIGKRISAFMKQCNEERVESQRSTFPSMELVSHSVAEAVEDIVSAELNEGFASIYRCPACGRVAIKDADSTAWRFFVPERGR